MLEGSDGFRHKDSLGGECVYRGGACQFMRSGKGAMHEEFWETRADRNSPGPRTRGLPTCGGYRCPALTVMTGSRTRTNCHLSRRISASLRR